MSDENIDYGVWHDFKKEKPPFNDPYLIILDGLPRCAIWVKDRFQEGNFITPLIFKPELITHWAYFPYPPKEFAKKEKNA